MELTLFVIVGAIAVVAAAMMLISENAVYSALFLILNFACIAFLFLMLNAPFLAMVQITVYAGAIMVLFLFVIMLLGAERVSHSSTVRFRYFAPIVIGLALLFLITASVAIVGGEIDLTQPYQEAPSVRVINVFDVRDPNAPGAIDVYLGDEQVAEAVRYGTGSSFVTWREGEYAVRVFRAGADPGTDDPLVQRPVELKRGEAVSLVAIGRAGGVPALAVAVQHKDFSDDKDAFWLTAVNARPEWTRVDVLDESDLDVLIEGVAYGEAVEAKVDEGTYDLGLYLSGGDRSRLALLEDREFAASDAVLIVFAEQWQTGNAFTDVVVELKAKGQPTFGSPTHVGRVLFSRYVLPLEMVALLLLVAMIGAIVLTHETLGQRRQVVRRLANPPAGLEQPAPGDSAK